RPVLRGDERAAPRRAARAVRRRDRDVHALPYGGPEPDAAVAAVSGDGGGAPRGLARLRDGLLAEPGAPGGDGARRVVEGGDPPRHHERHREGRPPDALAGDAVGPLLEPHAGGPRGPHHVPEAPAARVVARAAAGAAGTRGSRGRHVLLRV